MTEQKPRYIVKPRFFPRNIADIFVGIFVASIEFGLIFGVPMAMTYILFGTSEYAVPVMLCIYCMFMLFTVWSISLSEEGIYFRRILGSPKLIAWSEILSIEPVSRWELVKKGWLWPLFPAREMTASLSSTNHYRITWAKGFCYYPPADTKLFEQHVSAFMKKNA